MSDQQAEHPDKTRFGKLHVARQAERKVRAIKVPEWGKDDQPLMLYAYPLTCNEVIALEGQYATITEQNIMQIILQCMDGRGLPYFTLLDKPGLLNEPADIIGRVLVALNGQANTFTEELKKNNK